MNMRFNSSGAVHKVSDIETALGAEGLREINKQEFEKLKEIYTREVE